MQAMIIEKFGDPDVLNRILVRAYDGFELLFKEIASPKQLKALDSRLSRGVYKWLHQ